MKFIVMYALFFNHKKNNNLTFIKNSEYPICKNCIYYKKDDLFPNDYLLGKCLLFGKQDIISGQINNFYANDVRNNKNLCDIKGIYYKNSS